MNNSSPPTKYSKKTTVEILLRSGKGGASNRSRAVFASNTTTPAKGALKNIAGRKLPHSSCGNLRNSDERLGKFKMNRKNSGAEKAESIEPATINISSEFDRLK